MKYEENLDKAFGENVDDDGMIDFEGLKKSKDFSKAAEIISEFNLHELKTKEDKLAFWINAYNILAHKTSLEYVIPHDVPGIREIPGVGKDIWDKKVYKVGGKKVSLGQIEHKILRPMGEPRIHFSIVCSSYSCPPLRQEAYRSEKLENQLESQSRKFMQDTKYIEKGKEGLIRVLYVSPILKWFRKDFQKAEGFGNVKNTIKRYTTPEIRDFMEKGFFTKLKYKDYDWSLNKQ